MIENLMELGADPTTKDKMKKTPYNYCPDKSSRTVFRRYQAAHPDQWDYVKANFPSGPLLTPEEESRIANEKSEILQKEKEEQNRFLNLSDREKRALAAEKR